MIRLKKLESHYEIRITGCRTNFFLQGCGISKAEMVQEPNAFGKDVDGIVEGLKARVFSCGDEGKSNPDIASSTICCGNEKLTLLCREKVFL